MEPLGFHTQSNGGLEVKDFNPMATYYCNT